MTVWPWTLVCAAAGGLLNAVLVEDARLLPTLLPDRDEANRKCLARIGVAGNIVVSLLGASAIVGPIVEVWAAPVPPSSRLPWEIWLAAFFTGFLAARWVTDKLDKRLLRRAAWKAAAAPAAAPHTLKGMRTASPPDMFRAAEDLTPELSRIVHERPDDSPGARH